MIPAILPVLLAAAAEAGPNRDKDSTTDVYVCGQTNAMEYASYGLRFRTDPSFDPDRPISVTLVDRQTRAVSARTTSPARSPEHDVLDRDAWWIGGDPAETVYLLLLPRGELEQTVTVQVVQILAAGRAQWVNEFGCTRR